MVRVERVESMPHDTWALRESMAGVTVMWIAEENSANSARTDKHRGQFGGLSRRACVSCWVRISHALAV